MVAILFPVISCNVIGVVCTMHDLLLARMTGPVDEEAYNSRSVPNSVVARLSWLA